MFERPSLPVWLREKCVAIVGGGPAGLTLARLLQMYGVSVSVFERDNGPDARTQGGSLDLHEQSGQLALRHCGLSSAFDGVSRPEGQATAIYDKHGKLCAASSAEQESESMPEIDRGRLCDLLRGSLADGTIRWNCQLTGVEPEGDSYRLSFEAGASVTADVVVGCDGAWSKVRPFLTSRAPIYTGMTFVEARLSDVDVKHPQIAQLIGFGACLILGDNKGLLAQRNGDGTIRVYAARRQSERWFEDAGIDTRSGRVLRSVMLDWFEGWAPRFLQLLKKADEGFMPWPLYALSPEPMWPSRSGITLIGDAAHVMPPFLGAGANMAMLDAVELADHLVSERHANLHDAIRAFENRMGERMVPLVHQSIDTQDLMFCADAPTQLAELVISSKIRD